MSYVGRVPSSVPVTADDIPANSIDASKIIDGSIELAEIADNSITDAKLNSTKLDGIEAGATADQSKADIEGLGIAASSITGALPAISGSALTGVTPTKATIEALGIAASSITGALPAIDGSALTNLPGGGKVLQVAYDATSLKVSSSSNVEVDIGITASLTPTSVSNPIYIEWFAPDNRKESNNTNLVIKLYRQINGGGYSYLATLVAAQLYTANTSTVSAGTSSIIKDTTHNTTTQVDYKLYIHSGQNVAAVSINKDNTGHTGIRLMEVTA